MAKTPSKKAPAAKAVKASTDGKKKRSKKRVESYSTYIYKVLKQVHPDTGISKKGMSTYSLAISWSASLARPESLPPTARRPLFRPARFRLLFVFLSTALLNRAEDTIETFDLSNNRLSDMDLDEFVLALIRCRTLTKLDLSSNGIVLRGCASLGKLLENQESNLEDLRLNGNSIDDEYVIIPADSLTKNTKLKLPCLEMQNGITNAG